MIRSWKSHEILSRQFRGNPEVPLSVIVTRFFFRKNGLSVLKKLPDVLDLWVHGLQPEVWVGPDPQAEL